ARFDATRALLDYGFEEFEEIEIMKADQQFMGQETVPVEKGAQEQVAIAVKEPISIMAKTAEQGAYRTELELSEQAPIEAAVEKGQLVGKVRVLDPEGQQVEYLNDAAP